MKIKFEVSGRHVHLSKEHLHKLFGENYELKKKRDISQPGQYVAHEKVILMNGSSRIENVKIVGPARNKTQIEILEDDARLLKINARIRKSGDLENSPGVTIVGPFGEVNVQTGVIRADKHIHLSSEEAAGLGLKDGDYANIKINNKILNFLVRAGTEHKSAVHLDKDDAYKLGIADSIKEEIFGEILKDIE